MQSTSGACAPDFEIGHEHLTTSLDWCIRDHAGLVYYAPLGRGFLTGAFRESAFGADDIPASMPRCRGDADAHARLGLSSDAAMTSVPLGDVRAVGAQVRPWHAVWGKTDRGPQGVTSWAPLHQHLRDAAGVAGLLVDEWLSPQVISRIARDLPDGVADTRTLAVWLAAVHDVGKASPACLIQDLHLADLATRHGLRVEWARRRRARVRRHAGRPAARSLSR